jgi:hypothetical protein
VLTITPYQTKVSDLAKQIAVAYGMGATPVVRVKRAASWATASQGGNSLDVPALTTGYFELAGHNSSASATIRETFTDKGTLNSPACTGYVFPIVDQKEIFDGSALDDLIMMVSTSDSSRFDSLSDGESTSVDVTHRVYLEWKAKNPLLTLMTPLNNLAV